MKMISSVDGGPFAYQVRLGCSTVDLIINMIG